MELRKLELEDFEQSLKLVEYAFRKEFNEKQKDSLQLQFKEAYAVGIFGDNGLAAQLMILPFKTYINNKKVSIGGVTRVSSWPQQRRHGLVTKLIIHALETMKESGQVISYLAPFSFEFYRKYGWEVYSEYKKYFLKNSQFPSRYETSGKVEIRDTDIESLSQIYDNYATQYNGTLVRSMNWWESVLQRKKGHAAIYFREDGVPTGYILYEITEKGNNHPPKQFPLQRELNVHEFISLNEESRKGLLTFLANHDSTVEDITIVAPSNDSLPFLLSNPNIRQEIVPYFMARIVDAKAFLEQYNWATNDEKIVFVLNLTDTYASWNNGSWLVTINKENQVDITSSQNQNEFSSFLEIDCDIRTLSAVMLGYKRPTDFHKMDLLKGTDYAISLFETILPKQTTYMLDFF